VEAKIESAVSQEKFNWRKFVVEQNSVIILALLLIFAGCSSNMFFTKNNIVNILRQQAPYMVVSLGVMMVVMTGGIDLSISSIVAIGSIMTTVCLTFWGFNTGFGLFMTIVISVLSGTIFGIINGYLVANWNIKPFIVTIASSNIAQGIVYIITKGSPIRLEMKTNPAAAALVNFGQKLDPILGIPLTFYVAVVLVIIFYLLMKYTTFGRLIVATGSNEKAVRLAGINVNLYKASAYIISSTLAAFAGVLVAARAGISTPLTVSDDYGIAAISAVVIGGTSLEGGRGAVPLVVVGVFIMAVITNIMNLMSIAAYPQLIVKGLIMLMAVLIRSISDKQADKAAAKAAAARSRS